MDQMIETFKALSEGIRLRMLFLLMQGELCVCDLMAAFNEPQSKISRHLAYLKRSGLVESRRVGVWMHYYIRKTLDLTAIAQLDLIKKGLSTEPSIMQDLERMRAIKYAKLCESGTPQSNIKKNRSKHMQKGRK